jgi:hypothetical protein
MQSLVEIDAWAEANGGEAGVRAALAAGRFGSERRTLQIVEEWLRQREHHVLELRQTQALEATVSAASAASRAAEAAENAARWTRYAAIATAIGAFGTLVTAVLPIIKGPPPARAAASRPVHGPT